jgi:hypothetical protein
MWIAAHVHGTTVLFHVENESYVSWLKGDYGVGETREEAIKNLGVRISHE